jgi:GAF domain-containing protein
MTSEESVLQPRYAEALRSVETAQESLVVVLALSAVRELLGMDASYVTTLKPDQQTVDAVMGDPSKLGMLTGTAFPIEQTFCRHMVSGNMPNAIPDTKQEPAIKDLAATENIRSYIGVPVTFSNGDLHGTLCAASHEPRPGLGSAEVQFVRALAAIIASRVEKAESEFERSAAAPPSANPAQQ